MNRFLQIERAVSKARLCKISLNENPFVAGFRAGAQWADLHPIRYENIPTFGKKTVAEELIIFDRLMRCQGVFYSYFGNDAKQISKNIIEGSPIDKATTFIKTNTQTL